MAAYNRFFTGWRWSDDQSVWWRFLKASDYGRSIALTVASHGGDRFEDGARVPTYRPYLRLSFINTTVLVALPRFVHGLVGAGEYGFRHDIGEGFFSLFYGIQNWDGRKPDRAWHCHVPWQAKRFHAKRFYDLDGKTVLCEFFHVPGWKRFEEERLYVASGDLPKRSYRLRDYDGEEVIATVHIHEMHWKHGEKWCRWLSWFVPDKKRRSVDLEFSTGIGRKKNSWKGGTLGHGTDLLPGESVDAAMKRYCAEHEMTFIEALSTVYLATGKTYDPGAIADGMVAKLDKAVDAAINGK